MASKDIYNPNITKTMKVDEFKQIQSSSTTQTGYYLKETWLNKLKEIIKGQFEKPGDQGLAGFNLNVTSKDEYDNSDLKRFLVQQKFIMEDTLLELAQKSIHRFVDCIISFLPISCEVKDTCEVTNVYYTEE